MALVCFDRESVGAANLRLPLFVSEQLRQKRIGNIIGPAQTGL